MWAHKMLMSIAAHCMKEGSSQTKCYSIRTKLVRSFLDVPLVWPSMADLFLPKRVYSAVWSILHCCWTSSEGGTSTFMVHTTPTSVSAFLCVSGGPYQWTVHLPYIVKKLWQVFIKCQIVRSATPWSVVLNSSVTVTRTSTGSCICFTAYSSLW